MGKINFWAIVIEKEADIDDHVEIEEVWFKDKASAEIALKKLGEAKEKDNFYCEVGEHFMWWIDEREKYCEAYLSEYNKELNDENFSWNI